MQIRAEAGLPEGVNAEIKVFRMADGSGDNHGGAYDFTEIADALLKGKAVVLNIENVDYSVAQSVTDFIAGACFAIDGKFHQISDTIYIATPSNIRIFGDFHIKDGGSAV